MFYPSEKQTQALINMWWYLWIDRDNIESYFLTHEQFQQYWDELQKQIQSKQKKRERDKRFSKAIKDWKITYQQVNESRKRKLDQYYNNVDNLFKSWMKYYQKYLPSKNKVISFLYKKCWDSDLVNTVIDRMNLNDHIILISIIESLYDKGFSDNVIINKCLSKQYEKQDIIFCLNSYKHTIEQNNNENEQYPTKLISQIDKLISQWKDCYHWFYKLSWDFRLSKSDFMWLWNERIEVKSFNDTTLIRLIDSYRKKNKSDFEISILLSNKGYNQSLIKSYLSK